MQPTRTDLRHRRIFSSPIDSSHSQADTNNRPGYTHTPSQSVDETRRPVPRSQSLNVNLAAKLSE
jgi:hypothetical protein